jgi:ketosteroid isomerase-like protein
MDKITELYEIENLKRLMARFYQYGDAKDWDAFGSLFTEDAVIRIDAAPRPAPDVPGEVVIEGRDAFIEAMSSLVDGVHTAHNAYLPDITIIDDTHAEATWGMHDVVKTPAVDFRGYGHLRQEYVKTAGDWKITSSHTTRLVVEEDWR